MALISRVFVSWNAGRLWEALAPLLRCRQSLPPAATAPGGSGREVGPLGLSEGGAQGGENEPLSAPASPFPPTASIKLCQLLPPAKACLGETDLKGPQKQRSSRTVGLQRPPPRLAAAVTAAAEGRDEGFWNRIVGIPTLPG